MPDAELNPYAAPLASLVPEPVDSESAWRDGDLLVVRMGGSLPDRCIKCNAAAGGNRIERTLYWHSPLLYLLLLLALIPFVLALPFAQHKIRLQLGLCRRHRSKLRVTFFTGSLLVGIGIALEIVFTQQLHVRNGSSTLGVLLGLGAIVAGVACTYFGDRLVVPRGADRRYAWLRGVCREYLAELPDFREERIIPPR